MCFNEKKCYRPDEIASIIGVDPRTIYRYIKDIENPLPAFRPSGRIKGGLRIWGSEANKYFEKNKVDPLEE